MPSPRFIQGLLANLHYWQQQAVQLDTVRIRDLDTEFPHLLQAVEMGLVLPETQNTAVSLIHQVFFWIESANHVPIWLPLMEKVLAVLSQDLPTRFYSLKQISQYHQLEDNLDEALTFLNQAQQLALHLENEADIAEIHINLAQLYRRQRRYPEAEEQGQEALHWLPDDHPRLKALALQILGQIAHERGELTLAETRLREALSVTYPLHILTDKTRTMNALAITLHQQGKHDEALNLLGSSTVFLEDTPYIKDRIELFINQGSFLYHHERWQEAQQAFQRAEELLKQQEGLTVLKALVANNLGCIYRNLDKWLDAERYLQRSIALYRQIGDDMMLANAIANKAKLRLREGRHSEAQHGLDEALQLLVRFPESAWAQRMSKQLTDLRNTGDSKQNGQ